MMKRLASVLKREDCAFFVWKDATEKLNTRLAQVVLTEGRCILLHTANVAVVVLRSCTDTGKFRATRLLESLSIRIKLVHRKSEKMGSTLHSANKAVEGAKCGQKAVSR